MTVATKKRNGQTLPGVIEDFLSMDRFPNSLSGLFSDTNQFFPKVPEANISENNKEFALELAVPGLKKEDFTVDIVNGILKISAEKEEQSEEEGKNFRRKEFSYNSFTRSFYLPDNVTSEKIDAKYENGVLRIKLPKKNDIPAEPVKKIKVN